MFVNINHKKAPSSKEDVRRKPQGWKLRNVSVCLLLSNLLNLFLSIIELISDENIQEEGERRVACRNFRCGKKHSTTCAEAVSIETGLESIFAAEQRREGLLFMGSFVNQDNEGSR